MGVAKAEGEKFIALHVSVVGYEDDEALDRLTLCKTNRSQRGSVVGPFRSGRVEGVVFDGCGVGSVT